MKKSLKAMKEDKLFTPALLPKGNGKLLDYTDDNGQAFRYAQINTRAIKDCPFRSKGCEAVCYATKGNHAFPTVKKSREMSYQETKRADFGESFAYTVMVHKQTKRYKDATMIIRHHESGDFYSLQYLKKTVHGWELLENIPGWISVFYSKAFQFFLNLSEEEKELIRRLMRSGKIAMNLSLDDTTSKEQFALYLQMKKEFPDANTYYCTEHVNNVKHDNICDCADCAQCGHCNKATGETNVVEIHSASNADKEVYRANIV